MTRAQRSIRFAAGAISLAALTAAFASCAEAEDAAPKTEDAGAPGPADAGVDAITPIEAAAPDSGCDASDDGCVSHAISCDDAAWCPVPTTVSTMYLLTGVWGSSKNDVWAVGSGGTIIHYDGVTWKATPTTPKIMSTFRAVRGSGPNDVWAVSMTDTIFHTTGFVGGKATWTQAPTAASTNDVRAATAIWGSAPGELRVGARAYSTFDPASGEIAYFNQFTLTTKAPGDGGVGDGGVGDGGAGDGGVIAWEAVRGTGTILGIWGSSPSDLWLVADDSERLGGAKGVTRHGTPLPKGGLEWRDVDSQSSVALEALWGSSADDVWAVGDKGTIRRMRANALRWEIVPSPTHEALHAIWGSSANDVWAVGDTGTILHWDGVSWKPSVAAFPVGMKPHLYGIWGSAANDVWIVGDGIALHFTGGKS